MNGTLTPEDTPGGCLTMVVSLPLAEQPEQPAQIEQAEQPTIRTGAMPRA